MSKAHTLRHAVVASFLMPAFVAEEALQDLSGFDIIWVISHMHLNKGWNRKVRPPRLPEQRKGLFSTRSPHRPNPVALSSVRVDRVDAAKGVIYVHGLDLLDGEQSRSKAEVKKGGESTQTVALTYRVQRATPYVRAFLRSLDLEIDGNLMFLCQLCACFLTAESIYMSTKRFCRPRKLIRFIRQGMIEFLYLIAPLKIFNLLLSCVSRLSCKFRLCHDMWACFVAVAVLVAGTPVLDIKPYIG